MSDRDTLRLSFDTVAEVYERSRPQYAPASVDWIAARLPLVDVLDLGAGTGKFTRQLSAVAAHVIAVEPGDEMRRILERIAPHLDVRAGSAEAIPLADGSVDAVTVAQAFHWFDMDAALAEMHRVLRPGGGIALLWNEWENQFDELVEPLRPRPAEGHDPNAQLLATSFFARFEERTFPHEDRVDADLVVERLSSISAVIAASPDERDRVLAQARTLVGDGTIRFEMVTRVIAADRV